MRKVKNLLTLAREATAEWRYDTQKPQMAGKAESSKLGLPLLYPACAVHDCESEKDPDGTKSDRLEASLDASVMLTSIYTSPLS